MGMLQILILIPISFPIVYWIIISLKTPKTDFPEDSIVSGKNICVILPMRNESINVERKLSSVISEILPHESIEMIVADSNSSDGTREIATDFLSSSSLGSERWGIINFDELGKNIALNGVIEGLDAEIIVISDADANISPGWLKIVVSRLEEEEVGVVSGIEIEDVSESTGLFSFYRRKSNWLRICESRIDSTPVLEGSILAWKAKKFSNFTFNEKMNADDAQICFYSIRQGYRSIIDPRISFQDFERKQRTMREAIRRGQGLSLALLRNADLAIFNSRRKSKLAIINAISLYVLFPWCSLFFSLNATIAFSINPEIAYSWEGFSIGTIFLLFLTRQGRSLATGSLILIIAHIQAIFGKRYQNWEPLR
tara:strand:- start:4351 stop:5457 length:1107 start_codon:yes stop_codon:yes gene_type:complete